MGSRGVLKSDWSRAKELDQDQSADLAEGALLPWQIVGIGINGDEIASGSGPCGRKQSATLLQFAFAHAIGEEAELADADQASRQDVEQEAPYELDRIQSHDAFSAAVGVILPVKGDPGIF